MFISKIRAAISSKINNLNDDQKKTIRQVAKAAVYIGVSSYIDYRGVKALNKYCGDRYNQSAWMILPNDFIAAKELCTTRDSERRGKAVTMLFGSWARLQLIGLAGKVARKWIMR